MSQFSDRLAELIEARGVTQKYIADQCNVTAATISRYISKTNEPQMLDLIVDMAHALNCTTDYLLGASNLEGPIADLPNDERILLQCYERATPDDRTVLWSVLYKYVPAVDLPEIPCTVIVK